MWFWRTSVLAAFSVAALGAAQCNQVTGITAVQHDGLTFVYGSEPVAYQGASGANIRYRLYQAAAQITGTAGATLIQDESAMYNNGAIWYGGAWIFGQSSGQRQSATAQMLTLTNLGSALPAYTALGVSVNTATASKYYAITTVSTDASCTESGITVGGNSLTSPVSESAAANVPVQQYADTTTGTGTGNTGWDGTTGLPLMIFFHPSSVGSTFSPNVCGTTCGDQYAWFGEGSGAAAEGYEPGMQSAFKVWQDRTRRSALWHSDLIEFAARDTTPSPFGDDGWETEWRGLFTDKTFGVGSLGQYFYRFTENRVASQLAWAKAHYSPDAHKILCYGYSMGSFNAASGWGIGYGFDPGCASFVTTRSVVNRQNYMVVTSLHNTTGGFASNHNTTPALSTAKKMADDGTTAFENWYAVSRLTTKAQTRGARVPFLVIGVGRRDTCCGIDGAGIVPEGNEHSWEMFYALAQQAKTNRLGFIGAWNNGTHSEAPDVLLTENFPLQNNTAYPAFTNFSLDNNLGDGTPTVGDCNSGTGPTYPTCYINHGWTAGAVTETGTTWAVTVSNSQITGAAATVDVTPRNSQTIRWSDGQTVNWTTSAGGSGTTTVDSVLHVPTATGVSIPSGGTTITFTAVPIAAFPPHAPRGEE